MVEILDKAFAALKTLPKEDRDRIAWEIIARVEDKSEWDRIIARPESQKWLEAAAKIALRESIKARKPLSSGFISVQHDNLMRGGAYWKNFDDLPEDVQKLAETNYKKWKQNADAPGIRFKKIHAKLPIYSFRVGMRHRTVGVETDDQKIAWFWIGSFEHFKDLIESRQN